MPLVSTSGFLSDFGIMPSLVPVVKILKKNWSHQKNLGESGGQTSEGSDRESVNSGTLATSNIMLLLLFGEKDQ